MKVVRVGVKRLSTIQKNDWECYVCHGVYRFENDDDPAIIINNDDQRDGFSVQINCPTCGVPSWLRPVEPVRNER